VRGPFCGVATLLETEIERNRILCCEIASQRSVCLLGLERATHCSAGWTLFLPVPLCCPPTFTWPWWSDQDVFATLAIRGTTAGSLIAICPRPTFPARSISLAARQGLRLGRTVPSYALDAVFLLTLGAALLYCALPIVLSCQVWRVRYTPEYYLGLDYTLAASATGTSPDFAIMGFCCSKLDQVGRAGCSRALAFAAGLHIRRRLSSSYQPS